MNEWRDRGYVLDSDEEEIDSQGSDVLRPRGTPAENRTSESLDALPERDDKTSNATTTPVVSTESANVTDKAVDPVDPRLSAETNVLESLDLLPEEGDNSGVGSAHAVTVGQHDATFPATGDSQDGIEEEEGSSKESLKAISQHVVDDAMISADVAVVDNNDEHTIGQEEEDVWQSRNLKTYGKRGRGRPRKNPAPVSAARGDETTSLIKRGRGRPRRQPLAVLATQQDAAAQLFLSDTRLPQSPGKLPSRRGRGRPRKQPALATAAQQEEPYQSLTDAQPQVTEETFVLLAPEPTPSQDLEHAPTSDQTEPLETLSSPSMDPLPAPMSEEPSCLPNANSVLASLARAEPADTTMLDEPPSSPLTELPKDFDFSRPASPVVVPERASSMHITGGKVGPKTSVFDDPASSASEDLLTALQLAGSIPASGPPSQPFPDAVQGDRLSLDLQAQVSPAYPIPSRNLRARKAIQLHPYLIESEQYRQHMKARGYRPVHIASSPDRSPAASQEADDAEKQDTQITSSAQSQSLSDDAGSSQDVAARPLAAQSHNGVVIRNEDEDFPTLDQIINRKVLDGMQAGFKRRKLGHTPKQRSKLSDNVTANVDRDLDGPLSPPLTSDVSERGGQSSKLRPAFRLPPGMSPAGMPTPGTSSTGIPAIDVSSRSSTDSESDDVRITLPSWSRNRTLTIDTDDSTPSSEADESQIKRVQRRIKGVLPASWLRLDQKAQRRARSPTSSTLRQSVSPPPAVPQKGVAQRRFRRTSFGSVTDHSSVRPDHVLISDDSDSSEESSALIMHKGKQTNLGQYHGSLSLETDNFPPVDDMEDNRIDPMLASTSRARHRAPRSKKRQPKLMDAFSGLQRKPKEIDHHTPRGSSDTLYAARSYKTSRSKRPRNRLPQLSILDAPHSPEQNPRREPQFVRLAARQARRQTNNGRHSPTAKSIRLATHSDTQDALRTLQAWRAGTIVPARGIDITTNKSPRQKRRVPFARPSWALPSIELPRTLLEEVEANTRQLSPFDITRSETMLGSTKLDIPDASKISTEAGRGKRRGNVKIRQTRLQVLPIHDRPHYGAEPTEKQHEQSAARPRLKPQMKYGLPSLRRLRNGQLETSVNDYAVNYGDVVPEVNLRQLFSHNTHTSVDPSFQLQRFLKETRKPQVHVAADDTELMELRPTASRRSHEQLPVRTQGRRKLQVKRLDVGTIEYRQPSEPLPPADTVQETGDEAVFVKGDCLRGLGPFGTRYATDFDIHPLEIGTYFHQNSFIGSGDFSSSLSMRGRDLDKPAGYITLRVGETTVQWSAWTEEVSDGLNEILRISREGMEALAQLDDNVNQDDVVSGAQQTSDYLLRSLVRYGSGCVYFLDPIDRKPFLDRLLRFVDQHVDLLEEQIFKLQTSGTKTEARNNLLVNSLLYILCICAQMLRVAQHPTIAIQMRADIESMTARICRAMLKACFPDGYGRLRSFYEDNRRLWVRQMGVPDSLTVASVIVVLNHVTRTINQASLSFAALIGGNSLPQIEKTNDVRVLDRIWYDLFTVQPLLEIDTQGVLKPRSRFQTANDSWNIVKALLQRVFALYPASSGYTNPSLNHYIRSSLIRLYQLISRWGWHRCDAILGTVYDFFAKRGLSPLAKEDGRGSPDFLSRLDEAFALEVHVTDFSFHIFLKLLALGLQCMRTQYSSTKIRSIAWRFIPNHGRTYRKDEEISEGVIDALRNHHDLLSTLYWASPSGARPRLSLIQNLVDHSASHREACRLNVRAWGNLTRFQLSRGDDAEDIGTLAAWLKDMVATTVSQYHLARSEAQAQYDAAQNKGQQIELDYLDKVVTNNQRQIVATLRDILSALKSALKITASRVHATELIRESHFTGIFQLFDAKQPRTFPPIIDALEVLLEYLKLPRRGNQQVESQQQSEESQDYGDLAEFEQAMGVGPATVDTDFLHDSMAQFLSTCLGADAAVDDALLMRLVDTWVSLASEQINGGARDWTSYVDDYSATSWLQLRDTDQKRRFTPYFMSAVLQIDAAMFDRHRTTFIATWFISLLERDSMLKYQHRLTSGLLNVKTNCALLRNLPFAVDRRTGLFEITLNDIRERRMSLIASILSNMLMLFQDVMYHHPSSLAGLRSEYVNILKQAMTTMRRNYEELVDAAKRTSVAGDTDSTVHGAYVTFVQQIVGFMQQYTSDICNIDRFFTDSSAFPLPANDPTYVVGRLKSYASKLNDPRPRKQLVVFLQTVSERAAMDNQQEYLTQQLYSAMIGSRHARLHAMQTPKTSPSLSQMIMAAIFPAYLDVAFSTPCGWILALPLLESMSLAFRDALYDISITDIDNTNTAIANITSVLCALHTALRPICEHGPLHAMQGSLSQPHILHLVAASFSLVKDMCVFVDYVDRATGLAQEATTLIAQLLDIGHCLTALLRTPNEVPPVLDLDSYGLSQGDTCWADAREFCEKELRDAVVRRWTQADDGVYMLKEKSDARYRIEVPLESVEEVKGRVLRAFLAFERCYEGVFGVVSRGIEKDRAAGAGLDGLFF